MKEMAHYVYVLKLLPYLGTLTGANIENLALRRGSRRAAVGSVGWNKL